MVGGGACVVLLVLVKDKRTACLHAGESTPHLPPPNASWGGGREHSWKQQL